MGGRGSGSSFTVDTDQINDLKAIARNLEYANLAYTDSTSKVRNIRVGGTGGGTYTGEYNRRYWEQTAKARALSGANAKRAATVAAKQEAELKSIEQAIRIAQRRGIANEIF